MNIRSGLGILLIVGQIALSCGCRMISRAFDSGGTVYTVEVLTSEPDRAAIVERAVSVVQNRLDAVGIDGEAARRGEDRIEVKVYGSQDQSRLRNFLFTTHTLELKKVVSPPSPAPVQTFPDQGKAVSAAGADHQVLSYAEFKERVPSQFVIVEKEPIVSGQHVRSASAFSPTGNDFDYQISFTLNAEGAERFGDWTERNINNYIAVVLDDQVQNIAYIRSRISDQGEISGRFSKAAAEEIAVSLSSGRLPAKLKVLEEMPFK